MRLDKRMRRFYNLRCREAQAARPGCVLLHSLSVCEDGYLHIHFSCINHEFTAWREIWEIPDGSPPTARNQPATLADAHGVCKVGTINQAPAPEAPEEELDECDFEESDDLDLESSGPIPRDKHSP